uniref:GKTx n=1 Tax=Centruroides hentzi TaxID=88313 RepID=A0A2I9LP11_9SCOR
MKVLILIFIVASVMIMAVEMGRDSCVWKSPCRKSGYFKHCWGCCINVGHIGGTCMSFRCKCQV